MNDETLRQYISSERFIHDVLLERSENLVKKIQDDWKAGNKPFPLLITWPAETITSRDGKPIDNVCLCYMGKDKQTWTSTMHGMVARTRAYGMLLVDPGPKEVKLIFETTHGTRAWTIPVERHGDVDVLGAVQRQDDVECIGLLWNRKKASS